MEEDKINESAPKKNIIRRLYDWVLSWANTPYGTPALFVLSFAESSFFPIPPDPLQIALSASKPQKSYWYATVSLVASVLGAMLGYYIGYKFWQAAKGFFIPHIFTAEAFEHVKHLYDTYDFRAVFIAAVTPIPYKIFTIAGGACEIAVPMFIIASIIGRGFRFYLVASLMYFFGAKITGWIDKYFNIAVSLFTAVLIGSFIVLKYAFK
jgi:membrane protein YqaA with SNARE-associated domain